MLVGVEEGGGKIWSGLRPKQGICLDVVNKGDVSHLRLHLLCFFRLGDVWVNLGSD